MQPRKPEVTIFADASHDDRARVAGWGAWIKADGHISVTCGAAMKSPVGSVTEAELCALANALTVARLRGLLATGCVVMLQALSASCRRRPAMGQWRGRPDRPDRHARPPAATLREP